MKKYAALLTALSLISYIIIVPALAAEKALPQGEAELRKVIERGTPAEENKILMQLVGTWRYTASLWTGSGFEPQHAAGSVTNEMVLEGHFLSSLLFGTLNVEGHETYIKSQGLIGYDNAKKSFTSVWADSLSTGMMVGKGSYDAKKKAITETGSFTNPFNGTEEKFRTETRLVDPENYARTIFTIGKSGKETKLLEFKFTKGEPASPIAQP